MDRHTEAVDVHCMFKPVFFVSNVLGLSPYNAVGDTGNSRIIVTVSAIICSIGMLILNVGVFAYGVLTAIFTWEIICTLGESVILLETLYLALCAYCTCLLGCRQSAKHFEMLNNLIGETYYSVLRRDVQLLLIMQLLFVITIITVGVSDIPQTISELYEFHTVLYSTIYYVSNLAGFNVRKSVCYIYPYSQTYCSELECC
jgi:uncharacterized membrane protein